MGKKWTYGEEGAAFPVKTGQIWGAGRHLFACSDLMAHDTLRTALTRAEQPPTIVYCDPPWGQSLLNGFRTKAGLGRADHRWEELYAAITAYGAERGIPVWLEGSKPTSRDGQKVPGTMAAAGDHEHGWEVTYYRKHLSGLYYRGPQPHPASLTRTLHGMDDDLTPRAVMGATATTGLVIDPCAGRGVTSRCAEMAGWASVNNELNPHRVSAALARMQALTGDTPRRIA